MVIQTRSEAIESGGYSRVTNPAAIRAANLPPGAVLYAKNFRNPSDSPQFNQSGFPEQNTFTTVVIRPSEQIDVASETQRAVASAKPQTLSGLVASGQISREQAAEISKSQKESSDRFAYESSVGQKQIEVGEILGRPVTERELFEGMVTERKSQGITVGYDQGTAIDKANVKIAKANERIEKQNQEVMDKSPLQEGYGGIISSQIYTENVIDYSRQGFSQTYEQTKDLYKEYGFPEPIGKGAGAILGGFVFAERFVGKGFENIVGYGLQATGQSQEKTIKVFDIDVSKKTFGEAFGFSSMFAAPVAVGKAAAKLFPISVKSVGKSETIIEIVSAEKNTASVNVSSAEKFYTSNIVTGEKVVAVGTKSRVPVIVEKLEPVVAETKKTFYTGPGVRKGSQIGQTGISTQTKANKLLEELPKESPSFVQKNPITPTVGEFQNVIFQPKEFRLLTKGKTDFVYLTDVLPNVTKQKNVDIFLKDFGIVPTEKSRKLLKTQLELIEVKRGIIDNQPHAATTGYVLPNSQYRIYINQQSLASTRRSQQTIKELLLHETTHLLQNRVGTPSKYLGRRTEFLKYVNETSPSYARYRALPKEKQAFKLSKEFPGYELISSENKLVGFYKSKKSVVGGELEKIKPKEPAKDFYEATFTLEVSKPMTIPKEALLHEASATRGVQEFGKPLYNVEQIEGRVGSNVNDLFDFGTSEIVKGKSSFSVQNLGKKGVIEVSKVSELRVENPVSASAKKVKGVINQDLQVFDAEVGKKSRFSRGEYFDVTANLGEGKSLSLRQGRSKYFSGEPNVQGFLGTEDVAVIRPVAKVKEGGLNFSSVSSNRRKVIEDITKELSSSPQKARLFHEKRLLLGEPQKPLSSFSDKELGKLLGDLKGPSFVKSKPGTQRQVFKTKEFFEPKTGGQQIGRTKAGLLQIQRTESGVKSIIKTEKKAIERTVTKGLSLTALGGKGVKVLPSQKPRVSSASLARLRGTTNISQTSKGLQGSGQRQQFRPLQKPIQATKQRQSFAQKAGATTSFASLFRAQQKPAQSTGLKTLLQTGTPTRPIIPRPPPPVPPNVPTGGLRFSNEVKEVSPSGKPGDGYYAYVKEEPYKHSRFLKVNKKPLSREAARQAAFDVIDNTISQTGYIRRAGKPAVGSSGFYGNLDYKFRQNKKSPNRFTEKRSNAIDSLGEVEKLKASAYLKRRRGMFGFS